ncbi:MAG: hypothetical protein M3Y59_17125 [Myxococcota bacterium]|nr:hypothetical protein [Myxococcota bacterium]
METLCKLASRFAPALLGIALLNLGAVGLAAPLNFEDPRGDDQGPGNYLPPTGSEFRPGDFDLRRFAVRVEGQDAVLEVTLGAKLRRDIVSQRTNAAALDLSNGIFVQHIDIYVDNQPGAGFTAGLPGRRVAFAPEEAWDLAVTLTPQPGPTRTVLEGWNRDAAERVLTPGPLQATGNTVRVRVPLSTLGGVPQPSWGWSVMVSGALWDHSFSAFDRIRGAYSPDAFTVPVYGVPEERAFGGASLNGGHPYVIDVLLPKGASQKKVLGTFGPGQPAVVPMIYQQRPAAVAVRMPASGGIAVERIPTTSEASAGGAAAGLTTGAAGASVAPGSAGPSAATRAADTPVAEAPVGVSSPSSGASGAAPPPGPVILEIATVQGDTVVIPAPDGGVKAWQIGTVVDAEDRQIGRVVVTNVSPGFVMATVTEGKSRVQPGTRVRFLAPRQAR